MVVWAPWHGEAIHLIALLQRVKKKQGAQNFKLNMHVFKILQNNSCIFILGILFMKLI